MSMNRRQFLQTSLGTLTLGVLPSASESLIGLGIIGLGQQGQTLIQALRHLRMTHAVKIVALCDVESSALTAAIPLAPTAYATTRYPELLQRPDVQAVLIATPDDWHVEMTHAALMAGLDVYLEPPVARTLADVQALVTLAQSQQAIVQIGVHAASHPILTLARNLITAGYLGQVSQIEVAVPSPDASPTWQQSHALSDGPAALHLVETLEMVRHLMEVSMPRKVAAQSIWPDAQTNPASFHALLHYQEGFIVHFVMGLGPRRFSIYGTSGSVDLITGKLARSDGRVPIEDMAIAEELEAALSENALYQHIEDWLTAIRERHQPRLPIPLGLDHVTLVRASQSMETKKGY